MAYKALAIASGMILAASPLSAAPNGPAPAAGPDAQYCMRVGPVTGRIAETIECWTREQWTDQGVDVDQEWAKEGVRVIG
jgi:hypothetical protein